MRVLIPAFLVGLAAFGANPLSASAQTFGSSIAEVRKTYAEAETVSQNGLRVLELRNIIYAGVQWGRIDFGFNSGGHLNRLTMVTTASNYDAILRLAQLQLSSTNFSDRLNTADSGAPSDMQIRVCEGVGGQVSLTYEPTSSVS